MTFIERFHRPSPRATAAGLAMLASCLLITAFLTQRERADAQAAARKEFDASTREIEAKISVRMASHEQVLHSAAAFFDSRDGATRSEFRHYAERQKIEQTLPGIQGLGFAELVPRSALEQHLQRIHAEGFPSYRVWPEGERETYSAIVFLEPFAGRNLRAFGYDMFSEPVRRAAMERARDRDELALSGKVVLVQEDGVDPQPGVLMYAPVYRSSAPTATVAERRANLLGWVYSPYRMRDLISMGMLGRWDLTRVRQVRLEIFDGETATPEALLYDSQPQEGPAPLTAATSAREVVVVYAGHRWRLRFTVAQGLVDGMDYSMSWLVFGTGVAISLLLAGLVLSLVDTRAAARSLATRMHAKLRDSELRWRFAIDGAGDGLWDWNVSAGTVFFTDRWKTMLGFAEHEIGDGLDEWSKLVHPEDQPRVMADLQAHLDGHTAAYANEHRVLCKDGCWKWILDRGLVISRDADGKPLRMIGTHSDVSERKQSETALIQSEARLNFALQQIGTGAWDLDLRDHTAYRTLIHDQIFGYKTLLPAWTYEMFLEHVLPEDRADVDRQFGQAIAAQTDWSFECRIRRTDGEVRWIAASGIHELNLEDKPIRMAGIVQDITESKQAEAEQVHSRHAALNLMNDAIAARAAMEKSIKLLLESEGTLTKFVRYSPIYAFIKEVTSTESRVLYASDNFLEMIGVAGTEMVGKSMVELFSPELAAKMLADDLTVVSQGEPMELEETLNGRHYLTFKSPIFQTDRTLLAGYTIDITERKQAEAAINASLLEKEALLKEVHHRVKNNLQVITSLLRLEGARNAHPGTKSVLEEMQGRIRSMAMLHEALYHSGTVAGVDLGEYLTQLAREAFAAHNTSPSAVQLRLDLGSVHAEMDQALPCGLIVNELLANALEHGFPSGRHGDVLVELHPEDEGHRLRLRVSDTGVGLPADFATRRNDSLGLQLVGDLAGQLGGTFEIGPGPAAVFTVTCPAGPKGRSPSAA